MQGGFVEHCEQLSCIAALQLRLTEQNPGYEQALALIAQEGLVVVNADSTAIAMAHGSEVVCCARAGSLAPALGTPINRRSGLSSECLRTAEFVCCEDTDNDPRVDAEACREAGIRSVLVVPIHTDNGVSGVFAVFSRYIAAFGDQEARLLQMLSALVSSCTKACSEAQSLQVLGEERSDSGSTPSTPSASELLDDEIKRRGVVSGLVAKPLPPRWWASPGKVSECIERIRQDHGLRVLGRAKAYLTIEALYDGSDRSEAIGLFQRLMFDRAAEIDVVL